MEENSHKTIRTRRRKKVEFSKRIMVMEMALLWVNTLGVIGLAYYSVFRGADSAFPWLTAMVSLPWAAWGVSKTGYTMKSMRENTTGGIIYDSAIDGKENYNDVAG